MDAVPRILVIIFNQLKGDGRHEKIIFSFTSYAFNVFG